VLTEWFSVVFSLGRLVVKSQRKWPIFTLEGKVIHAGVGAVEPNNGIDSFGHNDVINEFSANQTARAKTWHTRIDKLGPDDQIIALAELEREFDKSGTIGGQIDSIRVTPAEIKWLTVKKQCDGK
jgi:hypothetical protein